jgi:hypothetical protein
VNGSTLLHKEFWIVYEDYMKIIENQVKIIFFAVFWLEILIARNRMEDLGVDYCR